MGFQPHYLPDLIMTFICSGLAIVLMRWARPLSPSTQRRIRVLLVCTCILIGLGAALATARVNRRLPSPFVAWARCAGVVSAVGFLYSFLAIAAGRATGAFDPKRRQLLKIGGAAVAAVPVSIGATAYIRRDNLRYREVDIKLPAHASALAGLRLVQVTDLHMGPFADERFVRRAIGMANEAKAHLAVVTGDFISSKGDPLDACLNAVSDLKTEAGIYGCNGNHEIYAEAQSYTKKAGSRLGINVLRNEAVPLQFNGTTLNLIGIDYQRRGSKYLQGQEHLLLPGAFNVLLSHNPDLFNVAAAKGFDLTIAGHTHGGQVTLEIIDPSLNIVRFTTPYVHGNYQIGERQLWVSRGIGTIGVPARLGAPPEVVCLRLCAT